MNSHQPGSPSRTRVPPSRLDLCPTPHPHLPGKRFTDSALPWILLGCQLPQVLALLPLKSLRHRHHLLTLLPFSASDLTVSPTSRPLCDTCANALTSPLPASPTVPPILCSGHSTAGLLSPRTAPLLFSAPSLIPQLSLRWLASPGPPQLSSLAWTLLLRLKTHQHSLSSPSRQWLTCPAVSQTPANGVINFPRQQGAVQVNAPYQL